jgi:BlaI family transcriptional regulator, penicillinase repressor
LAHVFRFDYEKFRRKICNYEILRRIFAFRFSKAHRPQIFAAMLATKPTDSELEILHILWEQGSSTVRQVNDLLNEQRRSGQATARAAAKPKESAGYTTTLKLLQIMFEKGLVTRAEDGRTHTYTALARESDTQGLLLQQFVDNAFRGSAARLVLQALGNHDASADELDEIKALISQLENNLPKP